MDSRISVSRWFTDVIRLYSWKERPPAVIGSPTECVSGANPQSYLTATVYVKTQNEDDGDGDDRMDD